MTLKMTEEKKKIMTFVKIKTNNSIGNTGHWQCSC